MLQTLFVYMWIPLLPTGLMLLLLRPILLLVRKKSPMTPRTRSVLWFLQALGFWAFFIASWMVLENVVPMLLEK